MTVESGRYARAISLIEEGRCVVLDGGIGTEVARVGTDETPLDERLWGARALVDRPDAVVDVHRSYVDAGCDVISTNTWGLAAAQQGALEAAGVPLHWLDLARQGLRLARQATEDTDVAVAFSLNGDVDSPDGEESIQLLSRLFASEPPDVILLETLTVLRPSLFATVEGLLETGLPVWLSFRRCRHGLCGVYGQHWGGPEGDSFGRAARRFEELGVGALLVNCIPPDHVAGMVSYLRDFTDLPLGAYPNLGYFTDQGWHFEQGVGGAEYAGLALRWRAEGAQIVGGCCGVRPDHIQAARAALEGTTPGTLRPEPLPGNGARPARPRPWTDARERSLYPLPFPDIRADASVEPPDDASLMAWRYLWREGIGAHQRCLDVGCGSGLLGIQLALNGAAHVRAIDVDPAAVASTETNAFRNGVADRLTAEAVDLYPWVPEERFDVIVASLNQRPVDPIEAETSHRIADYWGRNLLDKLIEKLPQALAPDGVAYVVQLSILSQARSAELLERAGFDVRVADFTLFGFRDEHLSRSAQIERVERLGDAHHFDLGGHHLMAAYLLEISVRQP